MLYYWKKFYFNKILILKIQVLLVKRFLLVCEVLMTKIRLWNFEKMVWNLNCDHFTYISFKKYLGSKYLKTSCILAHPNLPSQSEENFLPTQSLNDTVTEWRVKTRQICTNKVRDAKKMFPIPVQILEMYINHCSKYT